MKSLIAKRRIIFRLAIVVCFVMMMRVTLSGQGITTGVISGVVADPSGAVIPGAHIVATDLAKGAQFATDSQKDGSFALRAMPVDRYRLVVTASGFTSLNVDNVEVTSGSTTDLNHLQMGITAATQIEVSGTTAALLQTTDSQVTTTLDAQELSHLPFNNGFDTATELIPGVVSAHADAFSNSNGDQFSVNGQSSRFNNFELDGQSNNDNTIGGPQVFFGNQDALAELQVITNDFSAQYGRNAGAIVNYITKSGTNGFHGSGFELYQGQFLSSFSNQGKNPLFGFCAPDENPVTTGCQVPQLPRLVENRYGGTIGGPILKNRLWAFGSTYWDPIRTGAAPSTSSALTPTPDGIQALAAAFPNNPAVAILKQFGPYGVTTGNPKPAGTPVMETVTGPGGVTATIPFSAVQRFLANPYHDQEDLGRLDWQPTSSDHLFLRYFYQSLGLADAFGDVPSGGWTGDTDTAHSVGADWTHTFGPKWVDQLRYSFQQTTGVFQGGAYPQCTTTNIDACPSFVTFTASDDEAFGDTDNPQIPQGRIVKVTQIQNNATWSRGRQTLLFGGELDYQNSPSTYLPFYGGQFNYGSFSNFLSDGPLAGENAASSFLSLVDGVATTKFTELDAAGYIQDDWKAFPSLTLHVGLRWEYFSQSYNRLHNETVARESNPATAFWDTSLPLADRTVPSVNDFYRNFQPRIGFAWNPPFDRKLVVSAGYAINTNPGFYNIFSNDATSAPTANAGGIACNGNCLPGSGSFTNRAVRAANLASLPRGGDPRALSQSGVPTNFRPPYTQTYTFALQHQFGKAAVGEVRYTGSLTEKDFQSNNANPYLLSIQQSFAGYDQMPLCQDATAPGYGRLQCPYGHLGIIANTGWSNYDGLQTNLTTRNLYGLTGTVSYTFSKILDNATDAFRSTGTSGASISFPQNPLNAGRGERSVGGNDFPNAVGLGLSYAFPTTEKNGGLLPRLINGYALSSIYRFDSGQPYTNFQPIVLDPYTGDTSYCDGSFNGDPTVSVGVDTCRLVLSNKRAPLNSVAYLNPYTGPTMAGAPTLGTPQYVVYGSDSVDGLGNYDPGASINPASAHWIVDNMAYANAVNNPYPGSSRGINRGSSYSELDATITKSTAVREGVNIELSMGLYNALNQMYWGSPGTFLANGITFGTTDYNETGSIPSPTGFVSGNRIAILGAKVVF
ncbi:MAG TPA: carboxypeptidase regulatory-like domain-containing protein [Acidobacteriaceae bacterium]|jgi:hypothetical protein|nr:carboxypeptidase regulatory-like domain-containing protein [Acidobacteriaceae bacterium]